MRYSIIIVLAVNVGQRVGKDGLLCRVWDSVDSELIAYFNSKGKNDTGYFFSSARIA